MVEIDNVVSMMHAQLRRDRNVVRDMARRLGVNYAVWGDVLDLMSRHQIDRVEVADFLVQGTIVEMWSVAGVDRYLVSSNDPDLRISSATVSVHGEAMTIEVIALQPVIDDQDS